MCLSIDIRLSSTWLVLLLPNARFWYNGVHDYYSQWPQPICCTVLVSTNELPLCLHRLYSITDKVIA